MLTRRRRDVPGVRFDAPLQQVAGSLPRMDVVVFVGIASSGPFDRPVLIESAKDFVRVFGPDCRLAWDERRRDWLTSLLGPSVRGFFGNGGQRCWIVRVGSDASGGPPFNPAAFLDPRLADLLPEDLARVADGIAVAIESPIGAVPEEPLRGIYAAWTVEEATLIAVPDAVHFAWELEQEPVSAVPTEVPAAPGASTASTQAPRCGCGDARPKLPRCFEQPHWQGGFRPVEELPSLELMASAPGSSAGADGARRLPRGQNSFRLDWGAVLPPNPETEVAYLVEEATQPWSPEETPNPSAQLILSSRDPGFEVGGRSAGVWYYRVRAAFDGVSVARSNSVAVVIAAAPRNIVSATPSGINRDLLGVQRALLRLCVARGDLLAVLALPESYQTQEALLHSERLGATHDSSEFGIVAPEWLSHAAVIHPWLWVGDPGVTAEAVPARSGALSRPASLTRMTADGALCGVMAARSLQRGAWFSVANQPLADVVGLTPELSPDDWPELLGAGVNVICSRPRGFVALDALTLSSDPDLETIGVRRLLSLLRRVVLEQGPNYVFERNDAQLRRQVEGAFRGILGNLFSRGAFAGETAAQAYRVTTDLTLNPPASVDLGRLVVELKFAPSHPLSFLTVRLLQEGGHVSVSEVS